MADTDEQCHQQQQRPQQQQQQSARATGAPRASSGALNSETSRQSQAATTSDSSADNSEVAGQTAVDSEAFAPFEPQLAGSDGAPVAVDQQMSFIEQEHI